MSGLSVKYIINFNLRFFVQIKKLDRFTIKIQLADSVRIPTLEFQINGGCQISGGEISLKINKPGGPNNFRVVGIPPKNCMFLQ